MTRQVKARIPDRHIPTLEAYADQHGMSLPQTVVWLVGEHIGEIADAAPVHYDRLPTNSEPELGALVDDVDYRLQTSFDEGDTIHAIQPASRKVTYLEFLQTPDGSYRLWDQMPLYYQPLAWMTGELNALLRLDTELNTESLDPETGDLTGIPDDLLTQLENGGLTR